jgi:hypothetical protein
MISPDRQGNMEDSGTSAKIFAKKYGTTGYMPRRRSFCTTTFSVTKDVVALMREVIAVFTAATCSSPNLVEGMSILIMEAWDEVLTGLTCQVSSSRWNPS